MAKSCGEASDTETAVADKKKILRFLYIAVFLLISAIALAVNPSAFDVNKNLSGNIAVKLFTLLKSELRTVGMSDMLAVGALGALYNRELFREQRRFCLTSCIVSGFLSFLLIIGMSFSAFHNFDFIFGRKCQLPIALIVFGGMWLIIYSLVKLFYEFADRLEVKQKSYGGIVGKLDKHFFGFSVAVIGVCWLALELPFFPGSVPYDGRRQLEMYLGYMTLSAHHPLASTAIMGFAESLGEAVFGKGYGTIVYVVFQNAVGIVIFSSICSYVKRKTAFKPALVSVIFFAVVPAWASYAQAVMKDFLYVVIFAWFVLEYVKVFFGDYDRLWLLRLAVSSALVCVLRNNGAYIVLPALVILIFITAGKRKLITLSLAVAVVANLLANNLLISVLDVEKGPKVEALSIPLQQLARCASVDENAFSEEEAEIIDKIVRYEGIGERYNAECSDNVKKFYRDADDEAWSDFWGLWLDKLKEYPLVYVEATMNNVYGYTDPFYFYRDLTAYPLYSKDAFDENDTAGSFADYVFSQETRDGATNYVYSWDKIPLLSFLVNPAFYTWAGIILIGFVCRKKDIRSLLVFAIPLLNVLICFASPVNGYLRYMLPVMAIMPLLILVVASAGKKNKATEEAEELKKA